MTNNEHIEFWVESAENDLDSAFDVFTVGRYHWALFIGHLALEKVLKALYIQETQNVVPPKIHNLRKLVELSNLSLDQERLMFLDKVFLFHIEARYNVQKDELYKIATKEFTFENLSQIKEMFLWLKLMIK